MSSYVGIGLEMDKSPVKISKELIVLELVLRQNMLEYLIHENWKTGIRKSIRKGREEEEEEEEEKF
jgi:hypothetical protein